MYYKIYENIQSGGGSCSTIQPCHTSQHPYYDGALDDQSKDDLT